MGLSETSKSHVNDFKIYLEVERNFSKHTIRAYESDIVAFLIWLDTELPEEANHSKIKEYLFFIQKFNYSKTTLSRKISAIRTFYRYLYRERLVNSNPVSGLHSPKKLSLKLLKKPTSVFSPSTNNKMFLVIKSPRPINFF